MNKWAGGECENPLKDGNSQQITTFMDIVNYLKPKYVLMEMS